MSFKFLTKFIKIENLLTKIGYADNKSDLEKFNKMFLEMIGDTTIVSMNKFLVKKGKPRIPNHYQLLKSKGNIKTRNLCFQNRTWP
jgi:hypothetical protein